MVAGGGALTDAMYGQVMKFSINIMKSMHDVYGLSEDQIEKMSRAQFHGLKGTQSIAMLLGVGKSSQPIYANMVAVMRVEDSAAYLADYGKSIEQYNAIVKEAKRAMLPTIATEPSKVGDIPALQITMTIPQVANQQSPGSAKVIETMVGPGGKLVGWFAPANKETVVFGYVDKKHVQQTIEAIKQGKPGLASNTGVAKTAALLPTQAAMLVDLSPAGVVAFGKRMASAALPAEIGQNLKIPQFPKTPPIGMAVTTGHDELQACVAIPPEVLQAIAQYVGKVQAAQGGEPNASSDAPAE